MTSTRLDLRARDTVPRFAVLMTLVLLGACSPTSAPTASTLALAATPAGTPAPATSASPSGKLAASSSPSAAIAKITPIPGAPDSKVTVSLTIGSAHKIGTTLTLWDRIAITAPAGKAWHVAIDNQETSVLHNFTVASGKTFEERIFQTKNFLKGSFTYAIPALPAGSYLFICTIHAEVMTGTLTLQ
jgi:hypothetical protein